MGIASTMAASKNIRISASLPSPPPESLSAVTNPAKARRLAKTGAIFYKPGLLKGFEVFAMKKGIHPDYHFVTVQLNDGTTYRTRTTWGEAEQKLTLDIDPTTHPAWTGGTQNLLDRGGRLTRFNKKFKDFVKG